MPDATGDFIVDLPRIFEWSEFEQYLIRRHRPAELSKKPCDGVRLTRRFPRHKNCLPLLLYEK